MKVLFEFDERSLFGYVIEKELLLEIKQGILEAIYSGDGLDGSDGTYLLSRINTILGLDVDDHNYPQSPGE